MRGPCYTEKNCSDVVCPNDGVGCPTDSYRLPNLRAPGDCCSHPQGCECLPGSCPEPDCDEGEHARKVRPGNRKPGTCCPLFECVSNNDQVTNCMETECPELPASCRETRVPQGKCCPECVVADPVRENSLSHPGGCVSSSGKIQQNGEVWQEDPCTNCTCLAGETKCQAYMCDLRCDHPHYVPDECCPICDVEWYPRSQDSSRRTSDTTPLKMSAAVADETSGIKPTNRPRPLSPENESTSIDSGRESLHCKIG
ncbi:hypothetical protein ANN_11941 [Periplaneta americana]|uniref:VWFC domain-containing protein n=1 Tax=Periplaneta americana TaxID=6978 RepID=A0ABQ8T6G6_PERAM|nr:hypothetical protein ANN_11941 [Periplaneta americana]